MRNKISSVTLAVAFALIVSQTRTADAQVVPFNASGTEAMYDPLSGDYLGEGIGSHLGRMVIDGQVQIVSGGFDPEPGIYFAGAFVGTQEFIAANGDTMEATMSGVVVLEYVDQGQSDLVTGIWFPSFEITGGTGRFDGVTGSLEAVAINPPFDPMSSPWLFDWFVTGEIDLAKRRR